MNCYAIHMWPESPSMWDLDRLEGDNGIPLGIQLYVYDEDVFLYWEFINKDTMRLGALYQTSMSTHFICDIITDKPSAEQTARNIVAETLRFLRENKIPFNRSQDFKNFPRTVYEQSKF